MHRVPPDFVKSRVLIVGLFDGIGGLAVALSRLPLTVVGMISCEVDTDARRLMRRRWPGLIEWGDVRSVSREDVLKVASVYGQICDMVIFVSWIALPRSVFAQGRSRLRWGQVQFVFLRCQE